MNRERIADDVYVFSSQRYAQVTAGAVLTKEGVVLIDTLFYPSETAAVKEFLEERLGLKVRYIINTHYHADHTMGNCLFPEARIIGHARCRDLLDSVGREGLLQSKSQIPEFNEAEIVLPDVILEDGCLHLHLGEKMLQVQHMPGHSLDLVSVFLMNDRILFASDNAMPVPTLFDGHYGDLAQSLGRMLEMEPDCVVRGHGEVILRGEVEKTLQSDLEYLRKIKRAVEAVITQGQTEAHLEEITIESCGKSRVPLNGFVVDLHQANLRRLHRDLLKQVHLS